MLWNGCPERSRRLRARGSFESSRHKSGEAQWNAGVVDKAILQEKLTPGGELSGHGLLGPLA